MTIPLLSAFHLDLLKRIDYLCDQLPQLLHSWRFAIGATYALVEQERLRSLYAPHVVPDHYYVAETAKVILQMRSGIELEPRWLQGFYYNAALMRIEALLQRILRALFPDVGNDLRHLCSVAHKRYSSVFQSVDSETDLDTFLKEARALRHQIGGAPIEIRNDPDRTCRVFSNFLVAVSKEPVFSELRSIVSGHSVLTGSPLECEYLSTMISYGGPDRQFAKELNDALENRGVPCWFFENDSVPGKKLHREMYESVNTNDRVILVCSKSSLPRKGVINEIQEALQREAREGGVEILIPITIDSYVFSDWAPKYENIAQAVKGRVICDFSRAAYNSTEFEKAVERILKALRR
jgi:hypothetical protein